MDDTPDVPVILHTLGEAADRLRVSLSTVARLTRRGQLGVVKIGRRTFIAEDDIRTFVAARRRSGRDE